MLLPRPKLSGPPARRGGVGASVLLASLALAGCAHPAGYTAQPLAPEKLAVALEARSLDDPGLRKFLTENLHRDYSLTRPVEWGFETLCWVAFYYNPTLDVARAQWESARSAQITAGARPNPTLTLTPGFSSNPGGASPWLPAVGLDFGLDPAGQRDRRTEVARLNAEAARQAVFAAAWQVRSDLRRALLDLTAAKNTAGNLRAEAETHRQVLALLDQKRTAGAATATEVATARLALLRAENAALEAERQAATVGPRLAQALGLTTVAVARLSGTSLPKAPPPEALAVARRRALQSRADVLGALARYVVAESAVALEVERQHPGVHLGPGYQWDQGQNKWTFALSFELPVFNHNEGPLAEAEAHRHEAAAQFTAVQASVLAEIDSAVAAQAAVAAQTENLRRVQSELVAQRGLVEARQQAGAADQLELQNARLEVVANEQALAEAENQSALAAGQLEDALEIPFASLDRLAPAAAPLVSPPKP